tara:strand:- start:2779 stop:3459 length:681 start_codon:yes stop_codon:yes gene_type:complete
MYFEDNFTRCSDLNGSSLLNDRYSKVNLFVFTGGMIDGGFDLACIDNYKSTKKKLLNGLIEYDGDIISLRDSCISWCGSSVYSLNKSELIEYIEYRLDGNEGIIEFYNKYLTPLFEVISIRGYSQGDYAEIIFTNELMKEYNFDDKEKFISGMSDYFTNLFYDAPLYGRLEIDGEEIYLDDFQSDRYTYDKDQIVLHVYDTLEHGQKEHIIDWLAEELPTNLEYKY